MAKAKAPQEVSDQSTAMVAEIVPRPDIVRFGSVPIRSARDLVGQATEVAKVLAEVIVSQDLFKIIQGRRYVLCEGWTTLGAMLGIVPIEEYCRPIEDGFEAKIRLIRASDGGQVGGASAECTNKERTWKDRDSYALRSMALTRATGKAFRLSFSWVMKLAGFEPTPAEEMMFEPTGSKEAAQAVAQRKIAEHNAKKAAQGNMSDSPVAKPPEAKQAPKASPGQPHNPMAAPPASIPPHATMELVDGELDTVNSTRQNGAPLMTSAGARFVTVIVGGRKFYAFSNHKMSLDGKNEKPLQDILKDLKYKERVKFTAHTDGKGYCSIDRVLQLGQLEWDESTGLSVLRRGEIPGQAKLL